MFSGDMDEELEISSPNYPKIRGEGRSGTLKNPSMNPDDSVVMHPPHSPLSFGWGW